MLLWQVLKWPKDMANKKKKEKSSVGLLVSSPRISNTNTVYDDNTLAAPEIQQY